MLRVPQYHRGLAKSATCAAMLLLGGEEEAVSELCRHCKSTFDTYKCELCGRKPIGQCRECHAELAHGVIVDQNVHFCGSPGYTGWDDEQDHFRYGSADGAYFGPLAGEFERERLRTMQELHRVDIMAMRLSPENIFIRGTP